MNKEEKDEIRELLKERFAEVSEELEAAKESANPVDLEESIGRLSRMDAIQHQQIALKTQAEKSRALSQIKAALQRIDHEDFGDCIECGGPIEKKRLRHRPESVLCIECQRAKES